MIDLGGRGKVTCIQALCPLIQSKFSIEISLKSKIEKEILIIPHFMLKKQRYVKLV